CTCDQQGSTSSTCDIVTGQCPCKNNVVGRTCSHCRAGYWGHVRGRGCEECDCDPQGSISPQCEDATGQCRCRPGVGGPRCDSCLPGFWGFSRQGCKSCEPCGGPVRYCDPNSGRCVCPPNTEGDVCERCTPGSWDYHASRGCKPCSCSGAGALSRQCDSRTGRCVCREGYEGKLCTRCAHGYYGDPQCTPCQCDRAGTNPRHCDGNGKCQCDESGQCPCKSNVVGERCGKCARGTFGLSRLNPLGCTSCFCFRRTNQCSQAYLTWSQLSLLESRSLQVEFRQPGGGGHPYRPPVVVVRPWNTQEICYINLALPGERILSFGDGETRLNVTNQLHVIPGTQGNVSIVSSLMFDGPLYWQLPREFKRDKVLSYNGYLRFRIHSSGGSRNFPPQILQTYPLISLQGNWQLVLEYYPRTLSPDGRYEVKLHESHWRRKNYNSPVTRDEMMIALQYIQHILIRATHAADATMASLHDVTMDIAAEGSPVSSRTALGVEQCNCPPNHTGTSCQNPNIGYYRWFKGNYTMSTIIIDLVGESRPCQCNGRSETCDRETGVCQNCRGNTMGPQCEVCATGYYGDPAREPCKPCACPSLQQNFAKTCQADRYAEYICHCLAGYTGDKCDRCDAGYYGRPSEPGGSCVPCNCDPFGSLHDSCDSTGQCTCKEGIRGRDCSQCAPRHVTSATGCISCEDGCVNILVDEVEEMIDEVVSLDLDGYLPAPWPSLRIIENSTRFLRIQLTRYHSNINKSQDLLVKFDLHHFAQNLLEKAIELERAARRTYPPTAQIKQDAQSILDLLRNLYTQISETIAHLKNYAIGETPNISIGVALVQAEKILKEIQRRNFDVSREITRIELVKSKALLEKIKKMISDMPLIESIQEYMLEIDNKLQEMREIIRIAKRKIMEAKQVNTNNAQLLSDVNKATGDVRNLFTFTTNQNANSTQLLKDASSNLFNARLNFETITSLMIQLRNISSNLREDVMRTTWQNAEYKDTYVKQAHDHAMDLMQQAIKLEILFNYTRDLAGEPLLAAQAYQRIVEALKEAEEAARNASRAATRAFNEAYPGDPENSIVRRASLSRGKSEELQDKGEDLMRRVRAQGQELSDNKRVLGRVRDTLVRTKSKLSVLNLGIDLHLSTNISSDIQAALWKTEETNGNIERTINHVMSIHSNLTRMKEEAQELSLFDNSLLNDIKETIARGESQTREAIRMATNMRKTVDRIDHRSTDLRERIEALKRKIKQTRQHASSIRVSLTTDAAGVCTRKYRPALQPSTTTSIALSYTVSNAARNALLLYISSRNSSDFMAVEMVNRRIEFSWDAGGGAKRITHPFTLRTNNPEVSDDTKWYHISITRVGNIGQLTVSPANTEDLLSPPDTVTDASPPGFSKMDLLPSDILWVGGAPSNAYDTLKTRSFAGCLHTLSIDGENIGLWNFTENEGCGACNEGEDLVLRQSDEIAVGFNGKGYFKGINRLRRPKPYYSVVLSFKTLDEDALLFLAVNEVQNQYFSISLENGHVVFAVQFDSSTHIIMKSSKKLNNNRDMIQIQATVPNAAEAGVRMGRLVVGDQDQLGTVKGGRDLDLSRQPYFFGGVHPEFDKQRWGSELTLRSLLGCMSGLRVLDEGKNPLTDGQYYGLDNSCGDKPLYDIGFLGQGYVELESHELNQHSSFGFTFQTMESDALLMISTFVGQPLPPGVRQHPPDFYSVSLVEGHLDIRMNGGTGMGRMLSAAKYNDGKLHSFFVLKENRRVTLKVDDLEVNTTRLDRGGNVVTGPDTGGLYFGGMPEDLRVGAMLGSSRPLKGCIRDVIVNNNVVSFSRPVRFEDVYIGRCEDLPPNAMQGMEGDMKEIHACLPPTQHTVEYKALKFGDRMDSHVLVPLDPRIFRKNFNISFEFRTYYPNGLFFLASNTRKRQTQSISVKLKNGRVNVNLKKNSKKGRKDVEAMSNPGLNTGQWRKVVIEKVRKRLRLFIDNQMVKKVKGPRKINVGRELFLGGLPTSISRRESWQLEEVEPLRGCLRNLIINGEEYEIPSTRRQDHIVGVGQCFANVQPGSYFPGDAYAIYSDDFNVGPLLELRLEFRTWELNGIILSVADPRGTSLSLELLNGAVVLSVDMGVGHSFSARVGLRNRFSFCDNMWHTVKASYIKDSLTLRVDHYHEAYGFNGSGNDEGTVTGAPLYIGGLPESASQGTLTTRENFKGCIRNIVLNSERRDWTDMYKLQNVLLSACPVQ
ncbi:hypothetical protein Pcinc_038380, partial [Petrolisthes cinctipes]